MALTLRRLATVESYHSLCFGFKVPHNTYSIIVRQVCEAIVDKYAEELVKCPSTPQEWKDVAAKFEERWNFPHAVGAIDGKHIAMKKPGKSGSLYYNYKGFFSILLLTVVDVDYKFMWVDIGANGSSSDCSMFNDSELKEGFERDDIGLPPPDRLTNDDLDVPYYLIRDDAFPLRTWMMEAYSRHGHSDEERIFNYRRIVEHAFGILANRFHCTLGTMR